MKCHHDDFLLLLLLCYRINWASLCAFWSDMSLRYCKSIKFCIFWCLRLHLLWDRHCKAVWRRNRCFFGICIERRNGLSQILAPGLCAIMTGWGNKCVLCTLYVFTVPVLSKTEHSTVENSQMDKPHAENIPRSTSTDIHKHRWVSLSDVTIE